MNQRRTEHPKQPSWLKSAPLNVVAAVFVDGWTDLSKTETGAFYGKPPKGGPSRPVVQFDKDIVRAAHLARKAGRLVDAEIVVTLTPTDVFVEAFSCKNEDEELFYESAERTDLLAHLLTKCSVKLVTG